MRSDIAGLQKEDISSLATQYKAAHQHRMEETRREHGKEINALTTELDQSRSLLEDQAAELMVANGIAAAASAQAQEHLQTVRTMQSELKSAKMGLLLQQEQLKQREAELQTQRAAWMEEKSSILQRYQDSEQELKTMQQKLSRDMVDEDQALSVRSIVATSRALHPCSRGFFEWAAYVRKQRRIFRQHAAQGRNHRSFDSSRQRHTLQLVLLQWRQLKCRTAALVYMEVALTCLIVHRRLKTNFGLWVQAACLSNSAYARRPYTSPHNLLRTRVARILISHAVLGRKGSSQILALLSHVIHAFSNVTYSNALVTAVASFKAVIRDTGSPPLNLSPEANELFLLSTACLKWMVEESKKTSLHVRCRKLF